MDFPRRKVTASHINNKLCFFQQNDFQQSNYIFNYLVNKLLLFFNLIYFSHIFYFYRNSICFSGNEYKMKKFHVNIRISA